MVRAAIVADPLGQAYTAAEVTALYEEFGGRAPTAAQLAVWRGAIGGGADFTTVRAAILDDPLGTTHTAATVTALYRDYGGRNPSATELATWQHLIGGGADFSTVRAAILADPLGQTYTAAEVSALYREYGGRAPTTAELATWHDLIDRGADFGTVRSAILTDPLAQAHAAALPIGNYVLQYSNIDFAALSASSADLVITDGAPLPAAGHNFPAISDSQVQTLEGQGRLVVGYDNVAITDTIRSYWNPAWTSNGDDLGAVVASAPDWLKTGLTNSSGIIVDFSNPAWQTDVINQAVVLVERGYSGVFLDDVREYFKLGSARGGTPGVNLAADEMAEFIATIKAAIVAVNPHAVLIANADPYLLTNLTADARGVAAAAAYVTAVNANLLEDDSAVDVAYARQHLPQQPLLILQMGTSPPLTSSAAAADGVLYTAPSGYGAAGIDVYPATSGDDVLTGGSGPNVIAGLAGNDVITNGAGNDTLTGGPGDNLLDGGPGADRAAIAAASGTTTIHFDGSAIVVASNSGQDALYGIETIGFSDVDLPTANLAGIESLYQTYGGRDATTPELVYWAQKIADGETLADVRGVILADPLNADHSAATIDALYQAYGGRAATGPEVVYWRGQLSAGSDFATIRTAILDDGLGQTHSAAVISSQYEQYFGRAPSLSEVATWKGLILAGSTFDTLSDALLSDAGSAATGTHQLAAAAAAGSFHLGIMFGNVVISGFDPLHDVISLHDAGVGTIDPLDAAHARQITTLGQTTDVLITIDNHDSILLHNVTLAQLQPSDFVI